MEKENKSFKQFMLDLDPEVRTRVFQQVVKQCHVTPACVRMWEREDSSPQDWRIRVINLIAKRYGCRITFAPIKRRQHLEGFDPIALTDEQEALTDEQTQGGAL